MREQHDSPEEASAEFSPVEPARQGMGGSPEGDYLTLGELATWLKISRGSAWSLVMQKAEIPHYRFTNRAVRIARRDVEDYIRRCRSDATTA